MGWDGTGMNCYGMGWDGTEKYVPWTSLGSNAIERYFQIYKALPGCVSSFWTHQQGLLRNKRSPNSINVDYYKTN